MYVTRHRHCIYRCCYVVRILIERLITPALVILLFQLILRIQFDFPAYMCHTMLSIFVNCRRFISIEFINWFAAFPAIHRFMKMNNFVSKISLAHEGKTNNAEKKIYKLRMFRSHTTSIGWNVWNASNNVKHRYCPFTTSRQMHFSFWCKLKQFNSVIYCTLPEDKYRLLRLFFRCRPRYCVAIAICMWHSIRPHQQSIRFSLIAVYVANETCKGLWIDVFFQFKFLTISLGSRLFLLHNAHGQRDGANETGLSSAVSYWVPNLQFQFRGHFHFIRRMMNHF